VIAAPKAAVFEREWSSSFTSSFVVNFSICLPSYKHFYFKTVLSPYLSSHY
jgi:hypothetical protein